MSPSSIVDQSVVSLSANKKDAVSLFIFRGDHVFRGTVIDEATRLVGRATLILTSSIDRLNTYLKSYSVLEMEDEEAGKRSRVSSGHSTGQPPRKRVATGGNAMSSNETDPSLSDSATNDELEVSEHSLCGHVRAPAIDKKARYLPFCHTISQANLTDTFLTSFRHRTKSRMKSL
jgi:hypothetical protein